MSVYPPWDRKKTHPEYKLSLKMLGKRPETLMSHSQQNVDMFLIQEHYKICNPRRMYIILDNPIIHNIYFFGNSSLKTFRSFYRTQEAFRKNISSIGGVLLKILPKNQEEFFFQFPSNFCWLSGSNIFYQRVISFLKEK